MCAHIISFKKKKVECGNGIAEIEKKKKIDNCGNAIAENGRKKNSGCRNHMWEIKKKSDTFTIFSQQITVISYY